VGPARRFGEGNSTPARFREGAAVVAEYEIGNNVENGRIETVGYIRSLGETRVLV
jgi:hypothetical protein